MQIKLYNRINTKFGAIPELKHNFASNDHFAYLDISFLVLFEKFSKHEKNLASRYFCINASIKYKVLKYFDFNTICTSFCTALCMLKCSTLPKESFSVFAVV